VIIAIVAMLLGIAVLIWLWKVPLRKLIESLKESGSSSFEAYTIAILILAGMAYALYMITVILKAG
jgi:hypothetical protein